MIAPVQKGWQTSEFYVVILTNALAALAVAAPELSIKLGSNWVQPLAILLAGIANVVYPILRTHLKRDVAVAAASVPAPLSPVSFNTTAAQPWQVGLGNMVTGAVGAAAGHPIEEPPKARRAKAAKK